MSPGPARPHGSPRKRPGAGNLTDQAYERIRGAILRGELPLGGPISGRQLARQLRMSLLPVAHALTQLEADGLVESRPRAGTVVRMPTGQDIRGHYIVREALETQAARLFAGKATSSERRGLRAMAAALDSLYADPRRDPQAACHAHMAWHRRVAECAGCPELLGAIEKSHILVLNWLYNSAADFHEPPRRWHGDLAAVLSRGDPEAADRKMREHVRFGLDTVLRRLAASGKLADTETRVFARRPRGRSRPLKGSGKSAKSKGKSP